MMSSDRRKLLGLSCRRRQSNGITLLVALKAHGFCAQRITAMTYFLWKAVLARNPKIPITPDE